MAKCRAVRRRIDQKSVGKETQRKETQGHCCALKSEGNAGQRSAMALRGKAQRRQSMAQHCAGDATQGMVTAMIGTAKAVLGEARALQCIARQRGRIAAKSNGKARA